MYKQAYGVYQEAQANELDQAQLVLMMYRGAINYLNKALESGRTDKVMMGHYISKAKRVIIELMLSLNIDETGNMGEMLLDMYQRLFKKLNVAHMLDDRRKITEVKESLEVLEETWHTVFASEEYSRFKDNPEQFKRKVMAQRA